MRKRGKLPNLRALAVRVANAEYLAKQAVARCAQVEQLAGLLTREFRAAVDGSEARLRNMIKGEVAVIENLTAALGKLREPQSRIATTFAEARRAARKRTGA